MRGAHGVIALLVAGGLSIDDGARAVATALFERLREKLLRDGQDLRVVRAQRGWAYCGRILAPSSGSARSSSWPPSTLDLFS